MAAPCGPICKVSLNSRSSTAQLSRTRPKLILVLLFHRAHASSPPPPFNRGRKKRSCLLVFDFNRTHKKGKIMAGMVANVVSVINSSSCSPAFSESSSEAARDTNEGNEGVINYPRQELWCINHKINGPVSGLSANTHTQSQRSISLFLFGWLMVWEGHGGVVRTQTHTQGQSERERGLINQQKPANYRSNRLV